MTDDESEKCCETKRILLVSKDLHGNRISGREKLLFGVDAGANLPLVFTVLILTSENNETGAPQKGSAADFAK